MNDEQRELLSEYVDGELDAAGRKQARELAAVDPQARAYLESIERLNDRLKATFGPIADSAIPAHLSPALASRYRLKGAFLPLALAASLAVVAVLLIRQEGIDLQVEDRLAQMQDQILQLRQQTLENVPSGVSSSWMEPDGATRVKITPIRTYRTVNDRFCREYEERIDDSQGVEFRRGIACRTGKGVWPDRASVSVPDVASGQRPKQEF